MSGPPRTLRFTFDGQPLEAPHGASIASALLRNGIVSWRRTRVAGQARGLLCGIGSCFDCLVDVGTARAKRACVTALANGDEVRTSASLGGCVADVSAATGPSRAGRASPPEVLHSQVLVIGGGPAGLAAAEAAVEAGVSVVMVDSASRLGGQLLRQPSSDHVGDRSPDGVAEDNASLPLGPALESRHPGLVGAPGLTVVTGAAVWLLRARQDGFVAHLDDGVRVEAEAVVLAPGATELLAPFPGWELPGVVSAGAAQALLKAHGQLVGRRVVVSGSGPFLLPVAASLADAGAKVLAVVEALPLKRLTPVAAALAAHPTKAVEAWGYAATLARHGVPVRAGASLARCEGDGGGVRRAVVVAGDGGGHWRGRARVYDVDAVCTSWGFVPRLELARQLGVAEHVPPGQSFASVACDASQSTSIPGVFAAGEITGVAGGEVAALEGSVAGAAAAAHCLAPESSGAGTTRGVRAGPPGRGAARARRFAGRLAGVYRLVVPTSLIGDETVVCRCEDVRAGSIRAAVLSGAATAREVRSVTRCGMGYCQGRTCGPIVQLILADRLAVAPWDVGDLQKRPVATPVPLRLVADVADGEPGRG